MKKVLYHQDQLDVPQKIDCLSKPSLQLIEIMLFFMTLLFLLDYIIISSIKLHIIYSTQLGYIIIMTHVLLR